jgi:endonuclease YncB( thermonuclease family)
VKEDLMADVQIFWDPQGFALDSLGSNKYLGNTDGDTPSVSMSIRMLSIDAPETHYPGRSKPSRSDGILAELAQWILEGRAPISEELAAYLQPKLATGRAGSLQENQGEQATAVYAQMAEQMLTRPNGTRRNVFLHTGDEPFDQYGRLLAYVSPEYSREELQTMTLWQRASFNILMVRAGWAASFIIYPSLPKYRDLVMFRAAAKEAYLAGRGIWGDPLTLTGYEFRMCIKLHEITKRLVSGETLSSSAREGWIERYCVDLTTRGIYYPENYFRVAPYNRLFIWPKDVTDAVSKLNLTPGATTEGG